MSGGGRKRAMPEVRWALFEYFIDIRCSLSGRLPARIFMDKAAEYQAAYIEDCIANNLPYTTVTFNQKWFKGWCKEFGISIRKPNKKYTISKETMKRRVVQFLKDVWTVRHFFNVKYNKEPVIFGADQMPLHRNELGQVKTMAFKGSSQPVFVKENHSLSRERCTVMTTISSSDTIPPPPPEFLFKGEGTRTKLLKPAQWAPKGSYRLQNMLNYIKSLPSATNSAFPSEQHYRIFLLDNYSVHLDVEIREALFKKGYILILIGGGITSSVQGNDTHYHHLIKKKYRELESEEMLRQLSIDKFKIPSPSRDCMMSMLDRAWSEALKSITPSRVFLSNMITLPLDGSKNMHANSKLWDEVGEDMEEFRKILVTSPIPSFQDLVKNISPPEGVKLGTGRDFNQEGAELFDCDGPPLDDDEWEHEEAVQSDHEFDLEDEEERPAEKENEEQQEQHDEERPAEKVKATEEQQEMEAAEEAVNKAVVEKLVVEEDNPKRNMDLKICQDLLSIIVKNKANASVVLYRDLVKVENIIHGSRTRINNWHDKNINKKVQALVNYRPTSSNSTHAASSSSTPPTNTPSSACALSATNSKIAARTSTTVTESIPVTEVRLNKYYLVDIEGIGRCTVIVNSIENDQPIVTFCKSVQSKKNTYFLSEIPNDVNRVVFKEELVKELPEPAYSEHNRQIQMTFPIDLLTDY